MREKANLQLRNEAQLYSAALRSSLHRGRGGSGLKGRDERPRTAPLTPLPARRGLVSLDKAAVVIDSMKNMFGVIPGSRYGWPKNILHWKGIQESVLDLCATVPIHFVIADGIVAMEGNGPLNGTPRPLGKI